jgi:hypothetical protein
MQEILIAKIIKENYKHASNFERHQSQNLWLSHLKKLILWE